MILEYLKNTTAHPTAEQVYDDLREDCPGLSLSTVYRNLRLLSEDGVIRRMDTGESVDRFDADTSPHTHFICSHCKQVTDVFQTLIEAEQLTSALGKDYQVKQHTLYLYGLCNQCTASEQA